MPTPGRSQFGPTGSGLLRREGLRPSRAVVGARLRIHGPTRTQQCGAPNSGEPSLWRCSARTGSLPVPGARRFGHPGQHPRQLQQLVEVRRETIDDLPGVGAAPAVGDQAELHAAHVRHDAHPPRPRCLTTTPRRCSAASCCHSPPRRLASAPARDPALPSAARRGRALLRPRSRPRRARGCNRPPSVGPRAPLRPARGQIQDAA
jgi:hypothetical protein